ncbi:EthD domain-containing protein [Streptomyces sp. NBC_01320]|uniref:EthD domain-containing protein n=1 Tax=Streptomyces sp. NBC_01320 TaxID=2903824 RepID=UPI002E12793A|nr:EthD domain-containing protein [Streptomyces sp. NBC_01320]
MLSKDADKISIVLLLKRKPGTTKEQFRDHYNSVHAKMAEDCFRHVFDSYTRNLILTSGTHASTAPDGEAVDDSPYDAITVRTRADLAEMQQVVQKVPRGRRGLPGPFVQGRFHVRPVRLRAAVTRPPSSGPLALVVCRVLTSMT